VIEIVNSAIDIPSVIRSVADPAAGATDVFIGTTRNQSDGKEVIALEYDAFIPMALKELRRIVDDAKSKWRIQRISVVHRIGRVNIGEASVVIAVSSAHRSEAFEACRYVIDAIKRDVPIWKKEYFADGARWVDRPHE
jgi:molybdopterin synthase catalytic subunit